MIPILGILASANAQPLNVEYLVVAGGAGGGGKGNGGYIGGGGGAGGCLTNTATSLLISTNYTVTDPDIIFTSAPPDGVTISIIHTVS